MEQGKEGVILLIRVTPKAKKAGIEGWREGELLVRVHAPPDKGAANEEVVALLSKRLKIAKGRVEILSGHSQRRKRLLLRDLLLEEASLLLS